MAGSVGSEDGDMGFQIAPMVDVVFVLLLFFMASAGAQVKEKELTIKLPSGRTETSKTDIRPPIIIEIDPNGQIAINNEVYGSAQDRNLSRLREYLKQLFSTSSAIEALSEAQGIRSGSL
ncbi:MAG: biopolymer transporter ExbD [Verrucomicrobiaceae bacterium]|nr:MAG: biopolymer transporter ExbD [Verrucomicrobiaceae bacterium]